MLSSGPTSAGSYPKNPVMQQESPRNVKKDGAAL
jgi:hypothetical protein